MKAILIVSFLLLLFLNIFDGYSTYILMGYGVEEANVTMAWMMDKMGIIPAMVIYKGLFLGLLSFAIYKAIKERDVLTFREHLFVLGGTVVLVGYYFYFMLTRNLQYLLQTV